jgi:pyruvate/2-oxoglutarate dehydrogenase complex dihydrolipoamide dehydrogenase (E3) component
MKTQTKGEGLYNVVVIGGGTAGLVTAAGTAGLGGRVALVERNKMGGDCLNFGCVPSKALISSARLVEKIRHAEDWGLKKIEPQFDFAQVMNRMRARRAKIEPHDSQERFESLGVDVFRGGARFRSEHEVEVGGTILRGANVVIATGTHATIPKIEGIDGVPYFTNETIFDELHSQPESMIVLGGGPIGCELGQAFQRLGVKVTIVQRGARLLPKEDPEVGNFLEKRLTGEGVRVAKNAEAKSVVATATGLEMKVAQKLAGETTVAASVLLIAAGRQPNTEGLGLEQIGVATKSHGVEVNQYLQTARPHIYAAGDIVGPYLFTHMADAQARIVVRNILMPFQFLRQKIDYSVVPWCTYVEPEIATVGLNESASKKKNIEYDLIEQSVEEIDRAVVESEEAGFARVLVARGTDQILGVTLICEGAGELIHEFVLAMKCGVGLGKISATTHAYPTFAEIARKLGDKYNKTRLTPMARKIFAWLYARRRREP